MNLVLARLAAVLPALLLAAACGSTGTPGGGAVADVTASAPPPGPAGAPVPSGEAEGIVTVLDEGDGPRACLGMVLESAPPQCDGHPLVGWEWADVEGTYASSGETRWGQYVLRGTFDGTTFVLGEEAPRTSALHDAAPVPDPVPRPTDGARWNEARALEVLDELDGLPGYVGAHPVPDGVLLVVEHDDGSIQAWADATYGGHVAVSSTLRPVERG